MGNGLEVAMHTTVIPTNKISMFQKLRKASNI